MFSADMAYRIWQEQQHDTWRAIERRRLLGQARLAQARASKSYTQPALNWLGGKLVRWGAALQGYRVPTLPVTSTRKAH